MRSGLGVGTYSLATGAGAFGGLTTLRLMILRIAPAHSMAAMDSFTTLISSLLPNHLGKGSIISPIVTSVPTCI